MPEWARCLPYKISHFHQRDILRMAAEPEPEPEHEPEYRAEADPCQLHLGGLGGLAAADGAPPGGQAGLAETQSEPPPVPGPGLLAFWAAEEEESSVGTGIMDTAGSMAGMIGDMFGGAAPVVSFTEDEHMDDDVSSTAIDLTG